MKPCSDCGRMMRPQGVKAAEHPGTVAKGSGSLCGRCYYRAKRSRTAHIPYKVTPADPNETPCVLVRVDMKPATYRTLRAVGLDLGTELSRWADQAADEVRKRA